MRTMLRHRNLTVLALLALAALVAVLVGLPSRPSGALADDVDDLEIPVLSLPSDGADITDATPTLEWTRDTVQVDSEHRWQVQVDEEGGDWTSLVRQISSISDGTLQWTVSLALGAGDYQWRVRSCHPPVDEDSCGGWSDVWTFTINGPDLTVTKTDSDDPVSPGHPFGYSIVVHNGGNEDVPNTEDVVITDHLPPGFTYAYKIGTGWICTPSLSGSDGFQTGTHTDVMCTTSQDIAAGGYTTTLTLNVTAAASADTYTNYVEVGPVTDEINANNNDASEDTTVAAAVDLTVTKTDTIDPVSPGAALSYNIVVYNGGDGTVTDTVWVEDHLPSGFAYVSRSGTGWSCTDSTSYGDTYQAGTHTDVLCSTSQDIAADDYATTLTLNVTAASTASTYTNHVVVDPDGDIAETNEANNTDSETTTVTGGVDLTVSKTGTATVSVGGAVAYDIVVSNDGSTAVIATVKVKDHLPPGFTYVSSSGTNWSCTTSSSGTDTFQTGTHTDILCSTSQDIAADDYSSTLHLNVTAASTAGTYTNKVKVDPDGDIAETNENNNDDSLTTTVTAVKGDMNCDGKVDAVDALLILRDVADLLVSLPSGCPDIGS